jgi:hypothetical protein
VRFDVFKSAFWDVTICVRLGSNNVSDVDHNLNVAVSTETLVPIYISVQCDIIDIFILRNIKIHNTNDVGYMLNYLQIPAAG